MLAEKLQRISTTMVQPEYRVRWLKWWNSSDMSRQALHFPAAGFNLNTLESWLPKAAFWAEVGLSWDSFAKQSSSLPISMPYCVI